MSKNTNPFVFQYSNHLCDKKVDSINTIIGKFPFLICFKIGLRYLHLQLRACILLFQLSTDGDLPIQSSILLSFKKYFIPSDFNEYDKRN